jgi:hypothetical protein
MPTQKLTAEIIHAAIEGFESQKRRIDSQIGELRQLLSTDRTVATPASGAPAPKRKISAAGRRRMPAAQQARWAKARGETEPAPSPARPKPKKRDLSEAGRKAISEATKRRWALKKAEAQEAQTAVTKKAAAKKTGAKKPRKKAQKAAHAAVTPAAQ